MPTMRSSIMAMATCGPMAKPPSQRRKDDQRPPPSSSPPRGPRASRGSAASRGGSATLAGARWAARSRAAAMTEIRTALGGSSTTMSEASSRPFSRRARAPAQVSHSARCARVDSASVGSSSS
ncbi:MAG: hypothetical protein M5U28_56675 [Sandaracinaceae bacterium]|nr:hypothetical protein [Sandaracinaceae bacterium]